MIEAGQERVRIECGGFCDRAPDDRYVRQRAAAPGTPESAP